MVFFADNLKRNVWVAHWTLIDSIRQYSTPSVTRWNWRTMSSDAEMQTYGPQYTDYCIATIPNDEATNIRPFDRVWHTVPSNANDKLATDAQYEVVSVDSSVGGVTRITYRKLSKDA